MDRSNSLRPRVLRTLGEEPLQQLLERFAPLVPSPPFLLDLSGTVVVRLHQPKNTTLHGDDGATRRGHVEPTTTTVQTLLLSPQL